MKLRAVKIVVFLMGAMILLGFVVVAVELVRRASSNPSTSTPTASTLALGPDERVVSATPSGKHVLFRIGGMNGERFRMIDLATGEAIGEIRTTVEPSTAPDRRGN